MRWEQEIADIMNGNDLGTGTCNRRKKSWGVQYVGPGATQEHRQARVHPCQIPNGVQGPLHRCAWSGIWPSVEDFHADVCSLNKLLQQERRISACAGLVALGKAVVPGYLQWTVLHLFNGPVWNGPGFAWHGTFDVPQHMLS